MTFDPDDLPPVRNHWELPIYDSDGYFVVNEINRYSLNSYMLDRGELHVDNGQLTVYTQRDKPNDPDQARNWLPAPDGGFRFAARASADPTPPSSTAATQCHQPSDRRSDSRRAAPNALNGARSATTSRVQIDKVGRLPPPPARGHADVPFGAPRSGSSTRVRCVVLCSERVREIGSSGRVRFTSRTESRCRCDRCRIPRHDGGGYRRRSGRSARCSPEQ